MNLFDFIRGMSRSITNSSREESSRELSEVLDRDDPPRAVVEDRSIFVETAPMRREEAARKQRELLLDPRNPPKTVVERQGGRVTVTVRASNWEPESD